MATPFPVSGIVLAAGRSRRMGADNKLLLPWGRRRIIEVVVETALAASLQELVVVVGHEGGLVTRAVQSYPVTVATNEHFEKGLSTSVRAGVEAACDDSDGFLFFPGDMPAVTAATVAQLCRRFCEAGHEFIAAPFLDGRRGNPVIFGRLYCDELLALTDDRGAGRLIEANPDSLIEVEVDDPGIHRDVDTPEAYSEFVRDARFS